MRFWQRVRVPTCARRQRRGLEVDERGGGTGARESTLGRRGGRSAFHRAGRPRDPLIVVAVVVVFFSFPSPSSSPSSPCFPSFRSSFNPVSRTKLHPQGTRSLPLRQLFYAYHYAARATPHSASTYDRTSERKPSPTGSNRELLPTAHRSVSCTGCVWDTTGHLCCCSD